MAIAIDVEQKHDALRFSYENETCFGKDHSTLQKEFYHIYVCRLHAKAKHKSNEVFN